MRPNLQTDASDGTGSSRALPQRVEAGRAVPPAVPDDSLPQTTFPLQDILSGGAGPRLYVHDCMDSTFLEYGQRLGHLAEFLPERALLMAQPGDLVLLSQPVDRGYLDYLALLEIGPDRDDVIVRQSAEDLHKSSFMARLCVDEALLSNLANRLAQATRLRLNPFISTPSASCLQQRLAQTTGLEVILEGGPPDSVEFANRKDLIRELAVELEIPVAAGAVVRLSDDPAERMAALRHETLRVLASGHRAILRAAVSASGADLLIVNHPRAIADVDVWLARRPHIDAVLVETFIPMNSSPNVGLWVAEDGACTVTGVTDQKLSKRLSHLGNVGPYHVRSPGIFDAARRLGNYLSDRGFRGPMGMDFIIPVDPSLGYALAEVNGRINGATYPTAVHQRLNHIRHRRGAPALGAWVSTKTLRLPPCSFDELSARLNGLMLTPDGSAGVLPYGSGWLPHGLCSLVIFAPSVASAMELESKAVRRLDC